MGNPPHSCYYRYHQKHHQQQMLARMLGKKNPHTLLVGMEASTTTLENNTEASLKIKHRSTV
jgi:hypothetical protein